MKTIKFMFAMVVIALVTSTTFANHLGPVDLSKMEIVFTHGQHGVNDASAPEYYRFYFDRASGNYYIEYGFTEERGKYEVAIYEPTNKISPFIIPTMSFTQTGKRYGYAIKNGSSAKQKIVAVEIVLLDTNLTIVDHTSPSEWEFDEIYKSFQQFGGNTVEWHNSSDNKNNELKPGNFLDGFSMTSEFLPGITEARFGGLEIEVDPADGEGLSNWFPVEPSDEMSAALKMIDNDTNNYVLVRTIGPTKKPPTDMAMICDTFILDLIAHVREATAFGWIKHNLRKDDDNRGKVKGDEKGVKGQDKGDNDADDSDNSDLDEKGRGLPGLANSIIQKLTKVRRECLRGKLGDARENLRALIKQVNAQRGKHLTEEAYALIKFNAEFLLEKL